MFGAITHNHREPLQNNRQQTVIDEMVQDPICGVYFPRKDGIRKKIKGQELFFCSKACKDKYIEQNT
jgi:YHS domain-containing protein